jgi:hypothetical protein
MGAAYPQNPATQQIAEHSGLLEGRPLEECLKAIHRRLPLAPGKYAIHRARRMPVQVRAFDGTTDMLVLSNGETEFDTSLVTFLDQYENLAQDDFRALRVFDQDALAERAAEDPDGLVMSYLKSVGRSSPFRDFKEAVQSCAVPHDEWKDWWQTTKVRLIRNPMIDVGDGSQPKLTLRQSPRDFSATLIRDFDFEEDAFRKPALVLSYLDDLREGVPRNDKVTEHFWAGLSELMTEEEDRATAFFAWLCLHVAAEAVEREAPAYDAAWLAEPDTARRVAQLCGWEPAYIEHVVARLPDADPEWPARLCTLLPYAPYGMVGRSIATLSAAGEAGRINALMPGLEEPDVQHAELYAWLWRAQTLEEPLEFELPYDVPTMTLNLFRLVQQLSASKQVADQNRQEALASLRRTIGMKKYSVAAQAFSHFPEAEAANVFHALSSNTGLSTVMRAQLYQYISKVGSLSGAHEAVANNARDGGDGSDTQA